MAEFLFNLSFNAERENVTSREHSFNTIPCGVILSTTNCLPVRTISMMVPMVMCSMWFICSKYKCDTFYHQIPAFVSGRGVWISIPIRQGIAFSFWLHIPIALNICNGPTLRRTYKMRHLISRWNILQRLFVLLGLVL